MMFKFALPIAFALALPMAPALAATNITYDFSVGSAGYASTLTYSAGGGNTATLTALLYTVAPTALTSTSQFVSGDSGGNPAYVVRQAGGVSIATALEQNSNDELNQIDTQGGTNELLKISLTGSQQLVSAQFNYIDADDTLRIYGSNGNSTTLTYLGFGGEFYTTAGATHTLGTGVSGASATTTDPTGTLDDGDSFTVVFSKLPVYENYFFTSNNDTGDGYRFKALTVTQVAAIPETSSWCMMVLGFGAIGAAIRARKDRLALPA